MLRRAHLLALRRGGGGGNLTISVSASFTTLQAGQISMVGATVMHAGGNPAVTWSLSGCQNNCGTLGTNQNGEIYSAPAFVPATFTVSVTATAVADTSKSASVTLTINKSRSADCPTGNEGMLNGQYAFLLRGGGPPGLVAMIGSFAADGSGNITGGLEDLNGTASAPQTDLAVTSPARSTSVAAWPW